MRGHGETGGELENLSAKDHHDDCLVVYDYIKNIEDADIENITVFGSSYGGYQACLLVAKRPVENLILNAPAQYDGADHACHKPGSNQAMIDVMAKWFKKYLIFTNPRFSCIEPQRSSLIYPTFSTVFRHKKVI